MFLSLCSISKDTLRPYYVPGSKSGASSIETDELVSGEQKLPVLPQKHVEGKVAAAEAGHLPQLRPVHWGLRSVPGSRRGCFQKVPPRQASWPGVGLGGAE